MLWSQYGPGCFVKPTTLPANLIFQPKEGLLPVFWEPYKLFLKFQYNHQFYTRNPMEGAWLECVHFRKLYDFFKDFFFVALFNGTDSNLKLTSTEILSFPTCQNMVTCSTSERTYSYSFPCCLSCHIHKDISLTSKWLLKIVPWAAYN